MGYSISRYHDVSIGHRVTGHEGKCQHLHGHNYRIHFHCRARRSFKLDSLGRVIDFSAIKKLLCMWIETNWDHRFLAWNEDDYMIELDKALGTHSTNKRCSSGGLSMWKSSIVWVPFNPTAENMAAYLVQHVGPKELVNTDVELFRVVIEETAKCHAMYEGEQMP